MTAAEIISLRRWTVNVENSGPSRIRILNRDCWRDVASVLLPKTRGGTMSKADKKSRHHLHIELTPAQYRLLTDRLGSAA